jgi:hypothetical protein
MSRSIYFVAASLLLVISPAVLRGQGADAQDLTQSVFDRNKEADPTNSARALTDKPQSSTVHIEQAPLPPPPSAKPSVDKKTLEKIQVLKQQRENHIQDALKAEREKRSATHNLAALDETQTAKLDKDTAKRAAEAWDAKHIGQLRTLEAEQKAKAKSKENTEARISTAPLPARSY